MNEDDFDSQKYKWYSSEYSECMTQDNDDKCYDISNVDFFFVICWCMFMIRAQIQVMFNYIET